MLIRNSMLYKHVDKKRNSCIACYDIFKGKLQ